MAKDQEAQSVSQSGSTDAQTQTDSADTPSGTTQPVWEDIVPASTRKEISNEEADISKAIALSIQDQARALVRKRDHEEFNPLLKEPQATAAEPSTDLILSLNNAFDSLNDPAGDTAIYFGAPPQQPEQTDKEYQYIKRHFDRVHVMGSRTLRSMGDESKFSDKDLLSPTTSFRAERRLRKHHRAVLEAAERNHGGKFTYYIDLRPPSEDEEAVILITELTCTRGVLTWHLASDKYQLDPFVVLGQDDFDIQLPKPQLSPTSSVVAGKTGNHNETAESQNRDNNSSSSTANNDKSAAPATLVKQDPEPSPEYSPLRHHSGLERLLQAIQGNRPKLDSAPKVWTFFALARYFGCAAHERISGWITAWLYSGNNANFIQNNPEVAYRMAIGIRSPDLLRDAFSILVGERALIEAFGEYRPDILSPLRSNVHGRQLETLDDDERNRIDHAASAFVKRIRGITSSMCRDLWFLQSVPSYQELDKAIGQSVDEAEVIDSAKHLIKEYIRSRIYYVLCQDQKPNQDLEQDLPSTRRFRCATEDTFSLVYSSLNQPMRLFTNTFWTALSRTKFHVGTGNLANDGTPGWEYETQYTKGLKELYHDDPLNGIRPIARSKFCEKISAVNAIFWKHEALKYESGQASKDVETLARGSDSDAAPVLTVRNPAASPTTRLAEHASGSVKRRKTSDADTFVEDHPIKDEDFEQSEIFSFSPDGLNAPVATDGASDSSRVRKHSYGNSTHYAPSWKSTDGLLSGQAENIIMDANNRHHDLALRPKAAGTRRDDHNSAQANADEAWSPLQKASDAALGPSTADGDMLGDLPPIENGKISKPALGWLSSPKKLFNGLNKKWEPVSTNDDPLVDNKPNVKQRAHNQPLKSTYKKPAIKQAFSNSNTPGQQGYEVAGTNKAPLFKNPPPMSPIYTTGKSPRYYNTCRINPDFLLNEVTHSISDICRSMLHPPHIFHQTTRLPTNLFDTLLCLTDNEFRFLPLWADGNDDGTGGVFDDTPVPNLDPDSAGIESFRPGRIRRGYQEDDSVMSGTASEYEEVGSSQAISTVGRASKLATDGTETVKSISSASSAVPDNGTVIVDADDSASDALSVIHLGEEASGRDGEGDADMHDQEEGDLDFDDDEVDSDTDTVNGGEKYEMSESLKAFVQSDEDAHPISSHDQLEHDAEGSHQNPALQVLGHSNNIAPASKVDKGKGKAHDYPHGFSTSTFAYPDLGGQSLPFRERAMNTQAAAAAASSTQQSPPPLAFSHQEAGKIKIQDTDDDDEYEFL
jgi:hypothetical protein